MAKATSEDKLLAVIEGQNAATGKESDSKSEETKPSGVKSAFSGAFRTRIFNRVFAVICVGLTLYFMFDFYYRSIQLRKQFSELKNAQMKQPGVQESEEELDVNVLRSLEMAKSRSIFSLVLPTEKPSVEIKSETQAADILKTLKVAAIIWAGEQSQVMMEDIETKQSQLLTQGDAIKGFKIKTIRKSSVILERDGKEWMLQ